MKPSNGGAMKSTGEEATEWSRSEISAKLDISGDFLFLEKVSQSGPDMFVSESRFEENFPAFSQHLPSLQPDGGGVLPGIYVIEAMAQTAAFALALMRGLEPGNHLLARVDVLFSSRVHPGPLVCSAKRVQRSQPASLFRTRASQGGTIVSQAELTYRRLAPPISAVETQ